MLGEPSAEVSPSRVRDVFTRHTLWWVTALALAVRSIVAARTSVIFEDGPHFLAIAEAFAEGRFAEALAHPYHPLYPATIALAKPIFSDLEVAALAVSVLGGTVAVAACFALLRRAFDGRVAWIGATLLAVSPYPVRMTSDVASEGLYLACFGLALTVLFAAVEGRRTAAFLWAGVASGFAYLTRPEGAGLLVLGTSWLYYLGLRGDRGWREVARSTGALLLGGSLLVLPYLVLVSFEMGGFTFSGKKSLLQILGLSPGESPNTWLLWVLLAAGVLVLLGSAIRLEAARRLALRAARLLPALALCGALLVALVAPEATRSFAAVASSSLRPETLLFLVAGGFWVRRMGWRDRDLFFFLLLFGYVVLLLGLLLNYGYLSRRHFVPLLPLLLGYVGVGVVGVSAALARFPRPETRPRWLHAPSAIAAGLAFVLTGIALPKALHDHRSDALAERMAAEWLGEQQLGSGWVASSKRRTAYYADRRWQPLHRGGEPRSLAELAGVKVRYIVAGESWLALPPERIASPGHALRELREFEAADRVARVFELSRVDALARK